jgi:hypothetical protein
MVQTNLTEAAATDQSHARHVLREDFADQLPQATAG